MTTNSQERTSPQQRGQRIRALREALRLSRNAIGQKHQIAKGTIQNWEDARYGGLSEKGARKLVEAFCAEGINCSLEWLFYGIGEDPLIPNIATGQLVNATLLSERECIVQELQHFHKHNSDAVDFIIPDDAMAPVFLKGDLVAGKRYFNQDIEKMLGQNCIIQTTTGKLQVRTINKASTENKYQLTTFNQASPQHEILSLEQIFSLAPVLWLRRENLLEETDESAIPYLPPR